MLPDVCRRFANMFLRVCLTVVVCNNSIVLVLCLGLENVPSAELGLLMLPDWPGLFGLWIL